MIDNENEKALQEKFTWARSINFNDYNSMLGYYEAQACLEYARGTRLLDMPRGVGTLTSMMLPHFQRVIGVDASLTHLSALIV
jgi:hypothetical protein